MYLTLTNTSTLANIVAFWSERSFNVSGSRLYLLYNLGTQTLVVFVHGIIIYLTYKKDIHDLYLSYSYTSDTELKRL